MLLSCSEHKANRELLLTGNSWVLSQIIKKVFIPLNVRVCAQEGHGAETSVLCLQHQVIIDTF